jgi:hypothetical protein
MQANACAKTVKPNHKETQIRYWNKTLFKNSNIQLPTDPSSIYQVLPERTSPPVPGSEQVKNSFIELQQGRCPFTESARGPKTTAILHNAYLICKLTYL